MEKMWPYETDTRIPFYIRGPRIAPGTVSHALAANLDIAPTLLDLAGITVPKNYDGRSLRPLLFPSSSSSNAASWRTRTVISFAEGYDQYWGGPGGTTLSNGTAHDPQAEFSPPTYANNGKRYIFDSPQNQWRMLRVANASHNVSFVQWDPTFRFEAGGVVFESLFDVGSNTWEQTNLWPTLDTAAQGAWRGELDEIFACRGHHGLPSDCP